MRVREAARQERESVDERSSRGHEDERCSSLRGLRSERRSSLRGHVVPVAISFVLLLCMTGCATRKSPSAQTPATRPFPSTEVPAMITETEERIAYMVEYFWDPFTAVGGGPWLCDSTHVAGVKKTTVEEQVGMYTTLMANVPLEVSQRAVSRLFDRAVAAQKADTTSNIFSALTELMAKYLYDPNSPVRNEDIYRPYVKKLSESSFVSPGMREAYAFDAKMCSLNAVGTKATDFSIKDLQGKTHSLYGVRADYILLFFSNPGCPDCERITGELQENARVCELLERGKLAVVNVYIDLEVDKWREYAVNYPSSWLSGYDYGYTLRTDVSYSIRAIPSLYVLDSAKTVLMKDAPEDRVLSFLSDIEL